MRLDHTIYKSMLAGLIFFLNGCNGLLRQNNLTDDYPITPVSFTEVQIQDNFWLPRMIKNTEVTIPIAFGQSEETGRIKNFEVAGGLTKGTFCTQFPFDDSDVFKIIEGASYSLMIKPDTELEAYLDSLIYKIAAAQEEDGYLYTNRTILGDNAYEMAGQERWSMVSEHSHELYNAGHMYEAAVAHYQATGKQTFLDVAIKNANLIEKEFGWGKIEKYPGHQEIEIGLVKLFRITGEKRYLNLAKFFLDVRGPDGWEYNQAHLKPVNQREPVGHAVRALYMYAAMADMAALTGDTEYLQAIEPIWENLVQKMIYVTGGVGQSGGNEGFGPDYELPNMTAYCETCASIANVFWNHRMFLLTGEAKYIDIMERTMYNALLSGVSLSGDRFFYPNRLESRGDDLRKEWFGCACCPSNISRFLPSVPGYVYAHDKEKIFINLFVAGETTFETPDGKLTLTQQGNFPWDGEISIHVYPEYAHYLEMHVRIPGWAGNEAIPSDLYQFHNAGDQPVKVLINNKETVYATEKGYAVLKRTWKAHDRIQISLPMKVRRILANKKIKEDRGRFALQRGPLVFCLEEKDNTGIEVRHIISELNAQSKTQFEPEFLNGVQTITITGRQIRKTLEDTIQIDTIFKNLKAIPYAYWANRGTGDMLVWIPYDENYADPTPAPTLARLSKKESSGAKGNLEWLSDQYDPLYSNNHNIGYVHWWPEKDTTVWLAFYFEKPESVYQTKVYWFDDGPNGGCRIPADWKLYYLHDSTWVSVSNLSDYTITKDSYDKLNFIPVVTKALKLEVKLQEDFSSGVHEWSVR